MRSLPDLSRPVPGWLSWPFWLRGDRRFNKVVAAANLAESVREFLRFYDGPGADEVVHRLRDYDRF